ncbi:hypothetical protein TrRE_jg174, partial [Triparma retinervis]
GKSPKDLNQHDIVQNACTLTRRGELESMFTYLPSFSLVLPSSSTVSSTWDKYIFPTDGVTLSDLPNPASEIITDKTIDDVTSTIRNNLQSSGRPVGPISTTTSSTHTVTSFPIPSLPGCTVVLYGLASSPPGSPTALTVLTLGPSSLDVLRPCLPSPSTSSLTGRLVPAPPPAYSYLRNSLLPPLPALGSEYLGPSLKNVSPLDVNMYALVTPGKSSCYTGSESFKGG